MLEWAEATAARIRCPGGPRRILESGWGATAPPEQARAGRGAVCRHRFLAEAIDKARKLAGHRGRNRAPRPPRRRAADASLRDVRHRHPQFRGPILPASSISRRRSRRRSTGCRRRHLVHRRHTLAPLAGLSISRFEAQKPLQRTNPGSSRNARGGVSSSTGAAHRSQYSTACRSAFRASPKFGDAQADARRERADQLSLRVVARVGGASARQMPKPWWWGRDVDSAEALAARLREFRHGRRNMRCRRAETHDSTGT